MSGKGKTIAIVTLQSLRGHGQRLQNYATTTICRNEGLEPQNLVLEEKMASRIATYVKGMVKRAISYKGDMQDPRRVAAFETFNHLMSFRKTSWRGAWNAASEFDWIVTGSDQVWNPTWLDKRHTDWYYLKFAKPSQRIALAPSLGLTNLDERQAAVLRKGVEGFQRLSIRERRGAELIKMVTGREATVLADPTIVVRKADWIKVANYNLVPSTPYILAYMLGDKEKEYEQAMEAMTSFYGRLPVITLSDRGWPGEPPAGPAEFIGLIHRATSVITDSFHASVFSMLMGTPLTIIRRFDNNPGMFSRLESLADIYGLHKNIFNDNEYNLELAGDYSQASVVIPSERDRFLSYFRGCLNG